MKKFFLAVVALTIVAPVFAKHKKTKKKKKAPTASAIRSVSMHRTACFGRCPEYKIELNSSGIATYTGIRFVEDSGVYTKNIGTAKSMEIIGQLITYHVDTCRRMYESRITDVPDVYYTITYKDSVKKIFNANWGPIYLREIAQQMDEIGKVHDNSWKKAR